MSAVADGRSCFFLLALIGLSALPTPAGAQVSFIKAGSQSALIAAPPVENKTAAASTRSREFTHASLA